MKYSIEKVKEMGLLFKSNQEKETETTQTSTVASISLNEPEPQAVPPQIPNRELGVLPDLELGEGPYKLCVVQNKVHGYVLADDGSWVPKYRRIIQRYPTRLKRDNAIMFNGWKFTLMNGETVIMYSVLSIESDDSEAE